MEKTERIDRLAQANRSLKAQVRQLKKELSIAHNELLLLQDIWQDEIAELKKNRRAKRQEKKSPVCPQCGNPGLDVKTVGIWTLSRCPSCEYFNREQED